MLSVIGDMDIDTGVDFDDISPFVLGIERPSDYELQYGIGPEVHGDTDSNGILDGSDVTRFVDLLFSARSNALDALLANDTAPRGSTNDDRITSDSSIRGVITGGLADAERLTATTDGGPAVSVPTTDSGDFDFDPPSLGDGSADGDHTVRFVMTDRRGTTLAIFDLSFSLDTLPPALPRSHLDPQFDSTPVGDNATLFEVVSLAGETSPNTMVELGPSDRQTRSDGTGQFQFVEVLLDTGPNTLTIRAIDAAGNSAASGLNIMVHNMPPDLTLPAPYDNPLVPIEVNLGESLTFNTTVTDPGSTVHFFMLDLDNSGIRDTVTQPSITSPPDNVPGGLFRWIPNVTGAFKVTILATDRGGLADQETFTVNVVDPTLAIGPDPISFADE